MLLMFHNVVGISGFLCVLFVSSSRGLVADSLDMASMEIVRARRACTVPQLLLRSRELPSLPNTHAVPKRYEETKPVKVQNFTHQKIMGTRTFSYVLANFCFKIQFYVF